MSENMFDMKSPAACSMDACIYSVLCYIMTQENVSINIYYETIM